MGRYNGATYVGYSVWLYSNGITQEIGLTEAAHTRNDGYRVNNIIGLDSLNAAGQVLGEANRFNGGTDMGISAWIFSNGSTQEIGLTGAAHTRDDGYQYNDARVLNDAGHALGRANRFNGSTDTGQSVWLYSNGSTQEIGLTGSAYTRDDGYQYNDAWALNASGQVLGRANRFNGGTDTGHSAWLYSNGSTREIGLTGAAYTRDDGYQHNGAWVLNDAGFVLGEAARYNGNSEIGQSAWLNSSGSTWEIGLTDAGHTNSSNGHQYNYGRFLNAAGQVAGAAYRYNGSTDTGQSAWLYSNGSTREIGLTDAAHTRDDGYRYNYPLFLNAAGQVAGVAGHYGSTFEGQSVWLYSNGSTQEIGLTDAAHTSTDGSRENTVRFLNDAGQVAGHAAQYQHGGAFPMGQSAWLYSNGTTREIGLTDAVHTHIFGYQENTITFLNGAGQVAGYAINYYGGSSPLWQTAWFYDDDLGQTFALDFSVRPDGISNSYINYLGEDGLILGYYDLYDAADNYRSLGKRAFAWTLTDGFKDLGSLVDDGLCTDWSYLAVAFQANEQGQILGLGLLADSRYEEGVFLLTPVPEPEIYALMLGGLGLIGFRARWRKQSNT